MTQSLLLEAHSGIEEIKAVTQNHLVPCQREGLGPDACGPIAGATALAGS